MDFSNIQGLLFTGLRLFVALCGAFVGWLLCALATRIVYRMAFHRAAPGELVFLGRAAGAILVGVLLFVFLPPFGRGGGGGGGMWPFGGGSGSDSGSGSGTTETKSTAKDTAKGTTKETGKEPLAIEMIVSRRYKGDGRFYLIKGEEPAKTKEEVEDFLNSTKGRWSRMDGIIYENSVSEAHPAVVVLQKLAEKYDLPWLRPPEYRSKVKTFAEDKG